MPKVLMNKKNFCVGLNEIPLMLQPEQWLPISNEIAAHPQVKLFSDLGHVEVLSLAEAEKRQAEIAFKKAKEKAELASKMAEDAQLVADARHNEANAALDEYLRLHPEKVKKPSVSIVETEPIVEAKPEPIVEAKPEPIVEAKPEPDPIVEAKPEPIVEAKPEPEPIEEDDSKDKKRRGKKR